MIDPIEQPEKKPDSNIELPTRSDLPAQSGWRMFAYGILCVVGLVAVAGIALGIWSTRKLSTDPVTLRFAKIFDVSVARINNLPVGYADYMDDISTLRRFYDHLPAGAPKPTADELSDQVLERLVVNALIDNYAKKYQVTLSSSEIEQSDLVKKLIVPFGSKAAAEKEIKSRYNLTFDEYLKKVIYPILLEQKLQKTFEASTDQIGKELLEEQVHGRHILFRVDTQKKNDAKVKIEAEAVLARIKKGEDFATLAKQYGSDSTKDKGGDLGWFGHGVMVPEFEQAAFALQPGQISPALVKSQFGYHIIKVDEKRTAKDYNKFMAGQLQQARIEVLLPIHNPFADLQKKLPIDSATSSVRPPSANTANLQK